MKKMSLFVFALSITFLLASCAENPSATKEMPVKVESNSDPKETAEKNKGGEHGSSEATPSQVEDTALPMSDFFLPDGSRANFHGEGNEFAGYKIEVAEPHENYFVIYENNGGVFVRRTYEIDKDKINILEETTVNYKDEYPSLDAIKSMKPMGIYLQKPFTKGATFGKWTVVETDVTVETPYKTFDNAFVIEMQDEDAINRKYFVQEFGEVKRESKMLTGNNEVIFVTSTLESVDKK